MLLASLLALLAQHDSLGKCKELLRWQEFFGKAVNRRLAVFPKNGWNLGMKGGTIMKKQGGQDIVEFALMIPLFLAFLVGIALFGLYFSDWVSYNNLARSMAREAAVSSFDNNIRNPTLGETGKYYYDRYGGVTTHLYILEKQADIHLSVVDKDGNDVGNPDYSKAPETDKSPYSVKVHLYLVKNPGNYGFLNAVTNVGIGLPKEKEITYYMYDENNPWNRSTT